MHKIILLHLADTSRKIRAIKALRIAHLAATGAPMGLKEAKTAIDSLCDAGLATVDFVDSDDRERADATVALLRSYGITAQVREPQITLDRSLLVEAESALYAAGEYDTADRLYTILQATR